MKVEVLEKGNGRLKLKIEEGSHTILSPIVEILLEDERVKNAFYVEEHPLKRSFTLFVETKEGDPKKILEEAFEKFIEEVREFREKFEGEIGK